MADNKPTNRVRVQLSFEVSIHEPGLPSWLGVELVAQGLNALIDDGVAKSGMLLHSGASIQLTRVTEASLKRRATVARKQGRRG